MLWRINCEGDRGRGRLLRLVRAALWRGSEDERARLGGLVVGGIAVRVLEMGVSSRSETYREIGLMDP